MEQKTRKKKTKRSTKKGNNNTDVNTKWSTKTGHKSMVNNKLAEKMINRNDQEWRCKQDDIGIVLSQRQRGPYESNTIIEIHL